MANCLPGDLKTKIGAFLCDSEPFRQYRYIRGVIVYITDMDEYNQLSNQIIL